MTAGEEATVEAAQKITKTGEWMSRETLAERIEDETHISKSSALANISTLREYLEANGLETEERPENQGKPAVYWKKEEGESA